MDIEDFDAMFNERGGWDPKPADWGDPEEALNQRQFFDIMEFCLEKLPPNTARVFMMREVMELETDEICKELTITANNLWVILYRARMALRQCLEQNWFARNGATPARPATPTRPNRHDSAKPSATSSPARTRRVSCPGERTPRCRDGSGWCCACISRSAPRARASSGRSRSCATRCSGTGNSRREPDQCPDSIMQLSVNGTLRTFERPRPHRGRSRARALLSKASASPSSATARSCRGAATRETPVAPGDALEIVGAVGGG